MKNSFIFYHDFMEIFNQLTDEQAGLLIKAICNYEAYETQPEFTDPILKLAFIPIRQQLDRNSEKYQNRIETAKTNGLKGGRPKKTETENNPAVFSENEENPNNPVGFSNNPENPVGFSENPVSFSENQGNLQKPKKAVNVNVNVNDNVNDNDNDLKDSPPPPKGENIINISKAKKTEKEKEREELKIIRNSFIFTGQVGYAVDDWIKYKTEKKQHYKPQGLKSLLSQIQNNVTTYGSEAVTKTITESMASNYQGIVWDKLERSRGSYDFAARNNPTGGTTETYHDYSQYDNLI